MLNSIIRTGEVKENGTTVTSSREVALKAVNHPESGISCTSSRKIGKMRRGEKFQVNEVGNQSKLENFLQNLANIRGEGDRSQILSHIAKFANLDYRSDPPFLEHRRDMFEREKGIKERVKDGDRSRGTLTKKLNVQFIRSLSFRV
jgi:DNA repair ATPase RecN